jgi:SSS family transporter
MTTVDYTIVILYFLGVLAVGLAFSGRQRSLRDFFVAERGMPWWIAALSGIATIVSGISYLGGPALGFKSDFTFHQWRLGLPIALAIICGLLLPAFFRLNVTSIYEYLEIRFDRRTRLLASGLFVVLRLFYLSIVIYAPSLVLAQVFGLPVTLLVLITGLTTTVYTLLGGIKAVLWTDAVQLVVLLTGIVVTLWVAIKAVGGLGVTLEIAAPADRLRFFHHSWSFSESYTVFGGIVGGAFMMVSQFGSDQSEVQRYLTASDHRSANRAMILSVFVATLVGLALCFIGTALFAFYQQHPDKLASLADTNQVFPKFIVEELPNGFRGTLIAAILAASMSTISSVLNSLTTVTMTDLRPEREHRGQSILQARLITLAFGAATTALACFADRFGNILEASSKIINLLGGALVSTFLVGLLLPRANARSGFWIALFGLLAALFVATFTSVSFFWYGPIAAVVGVPTGLLIAEIEDRLRPRSKAYD